MHKPIETKAAPPAFSAYAQAVELPAAARSLHVSGQVGVTPEGTLIADARGQHAQAWANIAAILAEAGMELRDIYEVFAIVSDPDGVPLYREERDRVFQGHLAASTLIVAGLANPEWKVEIMVRAAKPV
jgi:enamine deaminase RidA (YjgF/YER057c/UK114 family)